MSTAPDQPWPLAKRVLCRFALVYLVLITFPFPLSAVPVVGDALEFWTNRALAPAVTWTARHVLRIDGPVVNTPSGSGDRAWDYAQLVCTVVLAAVAAAAWSLLARRTTACPRVCGAIRLLVRYYLGFIMIQYGGAKLMPLQFPAAPLGRLLQPIGDSTPMGLLWTFMGFSRAYTIFTGAAETLGGALLLFRRTTPAGALVCAGVLANVVALNFCYDVPVKLYSMHLLAMALLLLARDLGRIGNVLLFNRPAPAADLCPMFQSNGWNRAATALAAAFLLAAVSMPLAAGVKAYADDHPAAPASPLRGVWEVEAFTLDGKQPTPPDDARAWRHVVIDAPALAATFDMRARRRAYRLKIDESTGTLTLSPLASRAEAAPTSKPADQIVLSFETTGPETMTLTGDLEGRPLRALVRRRPPFNLTSRGFHWINEFPYNR
jgi:hypothetical protein